MSKRIYSYLITGIILLAIVSSCIPENSTQPPTVEKATFTNEANELVDLIPVGTEPSTSILQSTQPPSSFGPGQADFPADINPFTGLPVANPALLEQPALLVSITHFPPDVRPQAGLSFASWVFEYLIATGTTRFAAVFHGQNPDAEAPLTGDCEVRMEPFEQSGILLGNRVWLDKNADGDQSPEEPGLGGVCVNLYNGDGELVRGTSSDSNGYYAFNVDPGTYLLEFVKPEGWEITVANIGFEHSDSDAGQATGRTEEFQVNADVRLWDAGLLPSARTSPLVQADPVEIPPAQVGPVRSARLIHIHLQNFLQDSCLIYAGATDEIEQNIPACATVFEKGNGGRGSMLDISRMVAISEENTRNKGSDFNYANNLFTEQLPAGGKPAKQAHMIFSQLNQAKWIYDPSYQGWLRYVDNTSEQTEFHVDTDRLTGRQIYFENLVILFVEHELFAPLIMDMYLQQGEQGAGFVFRDGQRFDIDWSTRSGEYEKKTGLRRPIALLDKDGNPFPLRPGHSWIIIATPYSEISQVDPGNWKFRIYAPPGAGLY